MAPIRNAGTGTLNIHAVLASPIFEALPEGAGDGTAVGKP
jgi:hypothetical protein